MACFVPETLMPMCEDTDVAWVAALGNPPPRDLDLHASDPDHPDPVRTPPPSLECLSQGGRDKTYGELLAVPQTASPLRLLDRPLSGGSPGRAASPQQQLPGQPVVSPIKVAHCALSPSIGGSMPACWSMT